MIAVIKNENDKAAQENDDGVSLKIQNLFENRRNDVSPRILKRVKGLRTTTPRYFPGEQPTSRLSSCHFQYRVVSVSVSVSRRPGDEECVFPFLPSSLGGILVVTHTPTTLTVSLRIGSGLWRCFLIMRRVKGGNTDYSVVN